MPFKSEKQRRYLWANEPKIARDWSDKYGSRVKKQLGGILDIAYHGSPWSQDILSQGFKGSRVPTWAGFGKTFTSPSMNVATRYGTPIEVAQSARNFRLPFGGGIGKGGVSFGAETPLKPGQATKGMNLIQKLRAGQYLNSPTAQRLLKTGTTAMGSAGGGMFNAFTSLGTSGLPLAYVLGASKLQESLPMSLIGPGGIAEQNPYFGAMGVSVDPKIEETLRYGDTEEDMSIEELRDYFEGIKPEDMGLPKRGEVDWEKYMRGEVANVPKRLSNEEYLAQMGDNLFAGSTGNISGVKWKDDKEPFKYDDTDDDEKALSYAIKRSAPRKM
jgi:hypothetical protein